jgi:sugar/nucleoside kinase (ribokinase family)
VVTDGPRGAYASDGVARYHVPAYPDPRPPQERTGAGDAFASGLLAALTRGDTLELGLAWAPINAMSAVQQVGSQTGLLYETDLPDHLKCAPDSYTVTTW